MNSSARNETLATSVLLMALASSGHAGLLISANPTDDVDEFNLWGKSAYVHFTGTTSSYGPATLSPNNIPEGAVIVGSPDEYGFSNFEETYNNIGGAAPGGEISFPDNPRVPLLRYGPEVSDASKSIWFGGWGEADGVSFDYKLPAANGVLQLFTGGFGTQGATMKASIGLNEIETDYINPHGFDHWGGVFTVIWNNENTGDTMNLSFNNDPNPGWGNAGVVGVYGAALSEVLTSYSELAYHAIRSSIDGPFGPVDVVQLNSRTSNEVTVSAPEGVTVVVDFDSESKTSWTSSVDNLLGKASLAVRSEIGMGSNQIDVSTETNSIFWTPTVDADAGWRDQFVVTGGEGDATALARFRIHGHMSPEEESALSFIVSKRNLFGAGESLNEDLLTYALSSSNATGEEFVEYLDMNWDFTFGVPFSIEALLTIDANNNGSASFGETITLESITIPTGATLTSSGILHGTITSQDYGVKTAAGIPEPATFILMALGLAGIGFTRNKKQPDIRLQGCIKRTSDSS